MHKLLKIHPSDNTATALEFVQLGETATWANAGEKYSVQANGSIPAMHKIALCGLQPGEAIIKYGQTIGFASQLIRAGDHVHTHNCQVGEVSKDYAFARDYLPSQFIAEQERASFKGYKRPSGKTGTRNYIGIITSVNCSATVAKQIAKHFATVNNHWPNVDGVVALTHSSGCGMRSGDEGYETLRRTFEGFARHPNFGGILLLGLGCETMQLEQVMAESGLVNGDAFQSFTIQQSGGSKKAIQAGIEKIEQMLPQLNTCQREAVSASELTLAVQCGGSDAFSGITANPALGVASDLLVKNGGTVIYSETPEVYGAEHLLTRRAVNRSVGEKLIERITWWETYTRAHGFSMDNNPSPGNKAGGLTSILEKSLGAQAKSGTSPLMGVYKYAEAITEKGLVFMDSPGYDPVSVTGQIASGANVVCFTTGRGSAYGSKPTPCLKLCSNTGVFESMADDMDINCGPVLDGSVSLEQMGEKIFQRVLAVASGEPSCSEQLGYGDEEFNPWKIGAVV